jgi:hypothetical protein
MDVDVVEGEEAEEEEEEQSHVGTVVDGHRVLIIKGPSS